MFTGSAEGKQGAFGLVLVTVLDHCFKSRYVLKMRCCKIGSLGFQYTQNIIVDMVGWKFPNMSEFSELPAGLPAGPSVDS
jgi:hypothetical protein